ncbi:hypothetical protein GWI33_019846 [Rhynchophorus ferrugineus]|uniref:Uncharacterized protein n=1 Tax=Rhynchophorus ferrugineus TaxID=354439 RepID=A0A834HXK2_RHYFE|nr:hypothetical protein GWI33_019846 [Rhynchophorus ferrugineus]
MFKRQRNNNGPITKIVFSPVPSAGESLKFYSLMCANQTRVGRQTQNEREKRRFHGGTGTDKKIATKQLFRFLRIPAELSLAKFGEIKPSCPESGPIFNKTNNPRTGIHKFFFSAINCEIKYGPMVNRGAETIM